MIQTKKLLPKTLNNSRDFQLFETIYDVGLNYIKSETDLMQTFPLNYQTNSDQLDLLLKTIGCYLHGKYSNEDKNKIANTFIEIVRNKGSLNSIKLLLNTFLETPSIGQTYSISVDYVGEHNVPLYKINISQFVYKSEIALIEEILNYILPIGCLYEIETAAYLETDEMGVLSTDSKIGVSEVNQGVLGSLAISEDTTVPYTVLIDSEVVEQPVVLGDMRVGTVADKDIDEEEKN